MPPRAPRAAPYRKNCLREMCWSSSLFDIERLSIKLGFASIVFTDSPSPNRSQTRIVKNAVAPMKGR